MHAYTGVGSRETPFKVQLAMQAIAMKLATKGCTLRSGGAVGADKAFEIGADASQSEKEVYIIRQEVKGDLPKGHLISNDNPNWVACLKIAADIHPNWWSMGYIGRSLHARNVLQVLGQDLATPSDFLVCWSPVKGNSISGGTRTAWELAKACNIPCFNLYNQSPENIFRAIMRNI